MSASAEVRDGRRGGGIPTRRLFWIGVALLICYPAANIVDVWFTSRYQTEESAPAAVVLGAAQYNGEPSDALRNRLDTAAALYQNGRVELIVVTGGGQDADITTEAKTGYDYLRQTADIPDEDLRLENQGVSTYQSLAAVSRFLRPEGIDQVIVVTDPYHARRSQLTAEEVGLDADVYSTTSSTSASRLIREGLVNSVARLVSFRRLDNVFNG